MVIIILNFLNGKRHVGLAMFYIDQKDLSSASFDCGDERQKILFMFMPETIPKH